MRRVASLLSVLLVALSAGPASTGPPPWRPVPGGGFVQGAIEHVATFPLEAGGGSDAVRHDDLLVVSSFRSFSIYDVRDPLAPTLVSLTPLGPALFNERPQTNGELLLVSNDSGINDTARGRLDLYDIRRPEAPVHVGRWLSERHDHIWACVLDCAYAYSAAGTILDLSDPSAPRQVGDLARYLRFGETHVVQEVDDGIVVLGANPTHVLDARDDPTSPDVLAVVRAPTTAPGSPTMQRSIPARVAWPAGDLADAADALERDRLTVMTMETPLTGPCTDQSGWVLSFDTADWRATGTWRHLDTFQIGANGTFVDGAPPYNVFGCGAYGLALHPAWGDAGGRLAAVAFFEHGLRLLEVADDGSFAEVGGWLPLAGNAVTPVWMADDLLYVVDVNRGIDVLRVTGAARRS